MNQLDARGALDESDICIVNGEEHITHAGTAKILAMAAFHLPLGSPKKAEVQNLLNKVLAAASLKGFTRSGELRTAFALTCPPSPRAKALANDLASCFTLSEFFEAMGGTAKYN